jgi:D-alanine-D-alanine ligase
MAIPLATNRNEKLARSNQTRVEVGTIDNDIGPGKSSAHGGGDVCGPKFHGLTLRDGNRVDGRRTTVHLMPGPDRIRLVVLFGGQSAEHDVSRVTARHVLTAADPDRYDLVAVGITREGAWVECSTDVSTFGDAMEISGNTVDPFSVLTADSVVFPLLHGPMGEDGTIQGLLEIAGVPFVGSAVLGSSMSMDKIIAKQVADAEGFAQANWRGMHAKELTGPGCEAVLDELAASLGFPIFVKPANMGSSIGVSKVTIRAEFRAAVDDALRYDEWIVFEEGVVAREIEVAVLGHTVTPRASVPGEIVPGAEFYNYEDKYDAGVAQLHIPAPLSEAETEQVRELACRVFRAYRAEGLSRVDFFFESPGRGWLLNEINTIPGFTPISMYPQMWQASGLPYRALIDELVSLAIERRATVVGYRSA